MLTSTKSYFKGSAKMIAKIAYYLEPNYGNRQETVLATEDGVEWKPIKYFENLRIEDFSKIQNTSTYLAISKHNTTYIACSNDSINWSNISIPSGFDTNYDFWDCMHGMYYINGYYYLMVAYTNDEKIWLFKSTNLHNWQSVNMTFNKNKRDTYDRCYIDAFPTWGGQYFYMLMGNPGSIYRSSNGEHWVCVSENARYTYDELMVNQNGFMLAYGDCSSSFGLVNVYSNNHTQSTNTISKNWKNACGPNNNGDFYIKEKHGSGSSATYSNFKINISNLAAGTTLSLSEYPDSYSKDLNMFYQKSEWTPIHYTRDLQTLQAFDFSKALGRFDKAWVELYSL